MAEHPPVHETKLRVRYSETDAQRVVNNANYLSYRRLERQGYGFVVVEAHVYYKKAAFFDEG